MKVKESQGNILIHRNGELSCESLKECVATVLKPNILDVARVRHDSLVLFVVKFGSQASLESFFKSLHNGIYILCRHETSYYLRSDKIVCEFTEAYIIIMCRCNHIIALE